ncbi:MAG: nucleotidyltransferase family protein [Hyphococcus sp.]
MIGWGECGVIILAAGFSRRFGPADKLLTPFRGKPLAAHTASVVAELPAANKVAVAPSANDDLAALFAGAGISTLENATPQAGLGRSLALGVTEVARDNHCAAALVLLADMPFVEMAHLERLLAEIGDSEAAIAFDGIRQTPPALFRRSLFPALCKLTGDRGAKEILQGAQRVRRVRTPAEALKDIDTPADQLRYE